MGEVDKPHRGIPDAVFVEDVDQFMKSSENDKNADVVLRNLEEKYSKYRFMESNLLAKKRRLKNQIPDIRKSLEIVQQLRKRMEANEDCNTQFLLSEQVYVSAKVPPTSKVCLWLGANVMLEYTLNDAEALLEKNLQTAGKNLKEIEDDLDFLKDQCTTTEVNMARVYNWDVKHKQSLKLNPSP